MTFVSKSPASQSLAAGRNAGASSSSSSDAHASSSSMSTSWRKRRFASASDWIESRMACYSAASSSWAISNSTHASSIPNPACSGVGASSSSLDGGFSSSSLSDGGSSSSFGSALPYPAPPPTPPPPRAPAPPRPDYQKASQPQCMWRDARHGPPSQHASPPSALEPAACSKVILLRTMAAVRRRRQTMTSDSKWNMERRDIGGVDGRERIGCG